MKPFSAYLGMVETPRRLARGSPNNWFNDLHFYGREAPLVVKFQGEGKPCAGGE